MSKRKITEPTNSGKKPKLTMFAYQELAVSQMVSLENDVYTREILGETVRIRREIGALTLPPGAGKTLVCVSRLAAWLDEPASIGVDNVPTFAMNALLFGPRNGVRGVQGGRNMLYPQYETGEMYAGKYAYPEQLRQHWLSVDQALQVEEPTATTYLLRESLARNYLQTQSVCANRDECPSPSGFPTLLTSFYPPTAGGVWSWPKFGEGRPWNSPEPHKGLSILQEILKTLPPMPGKLDSHQPYSATDLQRIIFSPRTNGLAPNSCLVLVPTPVFSQWEECIMTLEPAVRRRFVCVSRDGQTPATFEAKNLKHLGGFYSQEKRVYVVSTTHKYSPNPTSKDSLVFPSRKPVTDAESCGEMGLKKYIIRMAHDLVFQDEFHLYAKSCLPLTYRFLWAVTATPQLPTDEEAAMASRLLAHALTAAVIRAQWVARQRLEYVGYGSVPKEIDANYEHVAQGSRFLTDSIPWQSALQLVWEEHDAEQRWGVLALGNALIERNLARVAAVEPLPEEFRALPPHQEHTVVFRAPTCLRDGDAEELARLTFAPLESKKALYEELIRGAYYARLFRKVGSLVPRSPAYASFEALKSLASRGHLRVATGLAPADLYQWAGTTPLAERLRLLGTLAQKLRGVGISVPSVADLATPKEAAQTIVAAMEEASRQNYESEFEAKFEEGCGVCLDDEAATLLTACCQKAICGLCAKRIEGKCPFCREGWERTRMEAGRLAVRVKEGPKRPTLAAALNELTQRILAADPASKILIVCSLHPRSIDGEMLPGGVGTLYCTAQVSKQLVTDFKGGASVLVLNERVLNYGLNFQFVDHLIIMDGVPAHSLQQIIGRVQRLGRTTPAQVYFFKPESGACDSGPKTSSSV